MGDRLESLVQRCLADDQLAWREVVRLHAGLVFAVARRHGLAAEDAEDVAQHAFAELHRRLRTIREPRTIPAWLMTTAARQANQLRRLRARDHQGATKEPSTEGVDLAALEMHHRVRSALDELGGRCRELLRSLYFVSPPLSYETIADRMGLPVGSIGPTRSRCLAKLAEVLAEEVG